MAITTDPSNSNFGKLEWLQYIKQLRLELKLLDQTNQELRKQTLKLEQDLSKTELKLKQILSLLDEPVLKSTVLSTASTDDIVCFVNRVYQKHQGELKNRLDFALSNML